MTGWKPRTQAVSVLTALLVSVQPAAMPETSGDEELPETFLEFLSEWENSNGEWQDPMEYEDPHWELLDQNVEKRDE